MKFQYPNNDFYKKEKPKIFEYKIGINNYYPRIYRPLQKKPKIGVITEKDNIQNFETYYHENEHKITNYLIEFKILNSYFEKISEYIAFDKINKNTFSNRLRQFILLCCTEIEAQFQGILQENNYIFKNNLSTKDYFNLKDILKLNEYKIRFRNFSNLGKFSPFVKWNKDKQTKSLCWYNNYNEIKHNKYENFEKANLKTALNCLAALAILLYAQFKNFIQLKEYIEQIFIFEKIPVWDKNEWYFFYNEKWEEKKYW